MDAGKILVGFAFILLSVALTVTPSHALSMDAESDYGLIDTIPAEKPSFPSPAFSPPPALLPGVYCGLLSDPHILP